MKHVLAILLASLLAALPARAAVVDFLKVSHDERVNVAALTMKSSFSVGASGLGLSTQKFPSWATVGMSLHGGVGRFSITSDILNLSLVADIVGVDYRGVYMSSPLFDRFLSWFDRHYEDPGNMNPFGGFHYIDYRRVGVFLNSWGHDGSLEQRITVDIVPAPVPAPALLLASALGLLAVRRRRRTAAAA